MAKDPICGMMADESSPLRAARDGQTYNFCSEHCRSLSARASLIGVTAITDDEESAELRDMMLGPHSPRIPDQSLTAWLARRRLTLRIIQDGCERCTCI